MKARRTIYRIIFGLTLLTALGACIDELDIETLGGDDADGMLVVEAVFTNEMKTQAVYLSRSDDRLDLETDTTYNKYIPVGTRAYDSVVVETGASVKVLGGNGTEFVFTEGQGGSYFSNAPFALEMGVDYSLEITTNSGTTYTSEKVGVKGTSEITNVYAERATSNSGVDGVAIYIDSEPGLGASEYYRYTYDETYKIVAPMWSPVDFKLTNYDPCALPEPTYDLEIVPREVQNQVCYNTVSSNTIELASTAGNPGSKVSKQMVRFIGRDNFIISHRYSILVKQLVQSADAYSYYETLKSLSQSEDIFSQVQPGALYANVSRKDGKDENVLGYVEAVGVTEKRLFFNFEDLFPGEELPPYPYGCGLETARESHLSYCYAGEGLPEDCPPSVIERVDQGLISYYAPYSESLVPNSSCPGPYVFVTRVCGDCTLLGANVVPEFWEE
ncbi:DUF4249 domain-containing protein [Allomuricauda sp. M10]|uniref:DUF4249 domain-containing protein n=1 Tax=Allomuricauda sp. M10 TaxID=2683292 RepID=UPI001D1884C8|nr:DUF4249 domain-containing protein [Muricauda sp. M10]